MVDLGDETGMISLRAKDKQIQLIQNILATSKIKDQRPALIIRNCSVDLIYKTHIQLSVNKWGKISAFPDGIASTPAPPQFINQTLHLYKIDFIGIECNGLAIDTSHDSKITSFTQSEHKTTKA